MLLEKIETERGNDGIFGNLIKGFNNIYILQ